MFESCLSILYNGYMKKIYTLVFFLLSVLAIDLHASDLSECKGSPLEVDSKNDTSKELRNSWTNSSATVTFTDGDKYVGEYKDGKFNGQGTYTFANGNKYVGEFKDNNYNGQGTMTYADGGSYVGEWKDDKRHGQGIENYSNGNIYEGDYLNDRWHGDGVFYGKDEKKVFVSSFVDGSTSTTKKGLAFEIYEPDIALRCLYKGPQVYKHNEKQIEFTMIEAPLLITSMKKNF